MGQVYHPKRIIGVAEGATGYLRQDGTFVPFPTSMPPVEHTHSYTDLEDIPATFTPSAHRHDASEIDNLVIPAGTWDALEGKPTEFNPSAHTHDDRYYTETETDSLLANKVSTEAGKGLSSNDYTTTEKNKLSGIADNANNYVHPTTHSIAEVSGLQGALDGKEPAFVKKTGHNKDFGTIAGTVSEGNHTHTGMANTTVANTFTKPTVQQADTVAGVASTSQNTIANATGNLHEYKKGSTVVAKVDINGGLDVTNITKAGVQKFIDQTYMNPAFTNVVNDVPPTEMAKLTTANWSGGNYIGEPIINTVAGMSFKSGTYIYLCDVDNEWSRLSRI